MRNKPGCISVPRGNNAVLAGRQRDRPAVVPKVSADPPPLACQGHLAVGLIDEAERSKSMRHSQNHPTNGLEGYRKRYGKLMNKGEVLMAEYRRRGNQCYIHGHSECNVIEPERSSRVYRPVKMWHLYVDKNAKAGISKCWNQSNCFRVFRGLRFWEQLNQVLIMLNKKRNVCRGPSVAVVEGLVPGAKEEM